MDVSGSIAQSQPVQLAFGIGGKNPATKGSLSILTEMADIPVFRGIGQVYLLPFAKRGTAGNEVVEATDESLYQMSSLPGFSAEQEGKLWHLYSNTQVILPQTTASVLVYGTSPVGVGSEVVLNHKYGALTPVGFGPMTHIRKPSEMGFDPVVIFDPAVTQADVPEEGQTLADILNGIVQDATYTVPYYYKLENDIVQADGNISRRLPPAGMVPVVYQQRKTDARIGSCGRVSDWRTESPSGRLLLLRPTYPRNASPGRKAISSVFGRGLPDPLDDE